MLAGKLETKAGFIAIDSIHHRLVTTQTTSHRMAYQVRDSLQNQSVIAEEFFDRQACWVLTLGLPNPNRTAAFYAYVAGEGKINVRDYDQSVYVGQ